MRGAGRRGRGLGSGRGLGAAPGLALALALALAACQPGDLDRAPVLDDDERARLMRLGPLPPVPASPTNAVADDPRAVALGHRLFFDTRLSADGQVACATCHEAEHGLSDEGPRSRGAFGRTGHRRASTLVNAAYNRFQFWDGRADSLWAQPIQAIENEVEGDFTRCEVVHLMAEHYRGEYEALFGPLPPRDEVPARARPGDAAWEALDPAERAQIDRVAANVGKALEAHMRRLVSRDSALDAWIEGDEDALSAAQLRGARIFVREDRGRCIVCHDGPNLTDDTFHNLGLHDAAEGAPDRGRVVAVAQLLADPLGGTGAFSDDPIAGEERLRGVAELDRFDGAFKTPTLRDVTARAPYGHDGSVATLGDWIDLHAEGFEVEGGSRFAGQREGTVRPFPLSEQERADLLEFLAALEGQPLPAALLRAPEAAGG